MIGRWLRRLYDWVLHFAGHRHAGRALFFVSVAEASSRVLIASESAGEVKLHVFPCCW